MPMRCQGVKPGRFHSRPSKYPSLATSDRDPSRPSHRPDPPLILAKIPGFTVRCKLYPRPLMRGKDENLGNPRWSGETGVSSDLKSVCYGHKGRQTQWRRKAKSRTMARARTPWSSGDDARRITRPGRPADRSSLRRVRTFDRNSWKARGSRQKW